MEQMRQTFSSISAAARQVAVNRQTGAWTAAARRQKARQVAVNRQTGIWTADTGAHAAQIGDLYVCHKITEQATGKTFYPDILYRHPWKERELVTGMQPLQRAAAHGALYDMEAAAVYQAGIRFFSPDRMIFLKVVSDSGVAGQERMTAEALTGLLEQHVKEVAAFLTNLREAADEERRCETTVFCRKTRRCWSGFCGAALLADDAGVGAAVYHVCGAYRIRLESGTGRMVCAGAAPVQRQAGREGAA